MFRKILPTTEVAKLRQVQAAHDHGGEKFPQIVTLNGCYLRVEQHGPKTLLIETAPCNFSPLTCTN